MREYPTHVYAIMRGEEFLYFGVTANLEQREHAHRQGNASTTAHLFADGAGEGLEFRWLATCTSKNAAALIEQALHTMDPKTMGWETPLAAVPSRHNRRWSEEEKIKCLKLYADGASVEDICGQIERSPAAVRIKLGLEPGRGQPAPKLTGPLAVLAQSEPRVGFRRKSR